MHIYFAKWCFCLTFFYVLLLFFLSLSWQFGSFIGFIIPIWIDQKKELREQSGNWNLIGCFVEYQYFICILNLARWIKSQNVQRRCRDISWECIWKIVKIEVNWIKNGTWNSFFLSTWISWIWSFPAGFNFFSLPHSLSLKQRLSARITKTKETLNANVWFP